MIRLTTNTKSKKKIINSKTKQKIFDPKNSLKIIKKCLKTYNFINIRKIYQISISCIKNIEKIIIIAKIIWIITIWMPISCCSCENYHWTIDFAIAKNKLQAIKSANLKISHNEWKREFWLNNVSKINNKGLNIVQSWIGNHRIFAWKKNFTQIK